MLFSTNALAPETIKLNWPNFLDGGGWGYNSKNLQRKYAREKKLISKHIPLILRSICISAEVDHISSSDHFIVAEIHINCQLTTSTPVSKKQ